MSTTDQASLNNPNEPISGDHSASKTSDSSNIDLNLTKKFLTGHRDLPSSTLHLSGTSSLSQAVHAALANVIQDPLIAATGDSSLPSIGSGDGTIHANNRCENCSKLRQQLTLLIYEVLNLENTMESKICDYVQRRLSEIAISEQLSKSQVPSKEGLMVHSDNNDNLPTSGCHYTMAQNNNHHLSDTTKPLETTNSISNAFKYRAERTLTFENVLIGDSTLKYLDPARFDVERKTYIKTMRGKRIAQALEFIQTTRFIGTKKIMFHIGANDLNRDKLSEQEVSEQIKELIVTTKTVSPQSDVYISLIFPRQANEESRVKTDKLNYLLQAMASPELKVFVIAHPNISHDIRGCFEDSTHLSKTKGTILFEENIKKAMGLKKSSSNARLTSVTNNVTKFPPTRLPLGVKLSQTHLNGYNMNNNALMNPTNLVNMNMLNANALSAYLSFLVNGFRS